MNCRHGRTGRTAIAALAAFWLVSCAAPRIRPDAALLQAQQQRERALGMQADWSLSGRLAISGPNGSGSGSLDWQQQGRDYRFAVRAPVTGKTWTLTGDDRHARLSGLRPEPVEARNAASLLKQELGWKVPMRELSFWVLGSRASGNAEILFGADGLPLEIRQDGWKVEYRDYDRSHTPPLPQRIFASQGEFKVRLAIRQWEMP